MADVKCKECKLHQKEIRLQYKIIRELEEDVRELSLQLQEPEDKRRPQCPACKGPLEKEENKRYRIGDYFQEVTYRWICHPCMSMSVQIDESGVQ